MNLSSRVALGLTVTAFAAASMALPASAADTTTTVAIVPGQLTLAAPAGFDLGNIVPGATVTDTLTGVSVADGRAGILGWTATVSISDFKNADLSKVIPKSGIKYTPGTAAESGTSTVTASGMRTAPTADIVQTATAVTGDNTALWDATVAVTAPSDALADSYTATIVHSVS